MPELTHPLMGLFAIMAGCKRFQRGLRGKFCICLSMRFCFLFCLLLLDINSGSAFPHNNDETRLFFVFGDSYADTGNPPPTASSWRPPYGVSWPGHPTGRFSDGVVKTDVLASEALCVSSPPPYMRFTHTSFFSGLNFATAGSGVMQASARPTFSEQVDLFSASAETGYFASYVLNKAIVFVSISGNDYAAYNGTMLEDYISQVVELIDRNLRRLYALGIRNFMVSSLAPFRCLPVTTAATGYTECPKNSTIDGMIATHNNLLGRRISSLIGNYKDSNFILLQQTEALTHILENFPDFGFTQGLRPCCTGLCGERDGKGNLLYTVCDDPDKHVFWDNSHPTQAGWKAVVDLYHRGGFTRFSPSLGEWVDKLAMIHCSHGQ